MAANSREARRRRILEGGSDRLALITDRIQTLPPSSSSHSKPPREVADTDAPSSSQTLISNDLNSTGGSGFPHGETEESDSIPLNRDLVTDTFHSDAYEIRSLTPSHEREVQNEISSVPTSEVEHLQPRRDSSLDVSGTRQQSQFQTKQPKLLTPSEISYAVSASEKTRLCCSVAVALLVVVSYSEFSVLGSIFVTSIISFRPLYLVLVTNLTVMVALLLFSKQRGFERTEKQQNKTSPDGDHWAQQLARTREAGLVMQNVMDAVFMDCAIYVFIVICGLSLVQT